MKYEEIMEEIIAKNEELQRELQIIDNLKKLKKGVNTYEEAKTLIKLLNNTIHITWITYPFRGEELIWKLRSSENLRNQLKMQEGIVSKLNLEDDKLKLNYLDMLETVDLIEMIEKGIL